MSKVLVERPRKASRAASIRRFKRLDPRQIVVDDDGFDPYPRQIGLKKRVKLLRVQKQLNENLGPLKRYLDRQVGRLWNEVWSEICANLKPTSTVQQHVRDHVADFVATKTTMIDGVVWAHVDWAACPMPLSPGDFQWGAPTHYVAPDSGRLLRNPYVKNYSSHSRWAREASRAAFLQRARVLGPTEILLQLKDGLWWRVTLAETEPGGGALVVDVVERAGLCGLERHVRYGRSNVHAVDKHMLSKRDLKRFGLTSG